MDRDRQLRRVLVSAVLALPIVIITINVGAGETIRLRCSGALSLYEENIPLARVNDEIVTVDLDGKLVHGLFAGPHRISRIGQDAISVWSRVRFKDGVEGTVQGAIDRATGKTYLFAQRDTQPNQMVFYYDLVCRPVRQLF